MMYIKQQWADRAVSPLLFYFERELFFFKDFLACNDIGD